MTPEQFKEHMKALKAIEFNTRLLLILFTLITVAGLIAMVALKNQTG